MPDKVVDASVLGALIFHEDNWEEAYADLQDANIYAPTLLTYELTSIARSKYLRFPEQADEISQALQIGLSMNMSLVNVNHNVVFRLSLETGLTPYDASYLYLAISLGIPLSTFDRRLERLGREFLS